MKHGFGRMLTGADLVHSDGLTLLWSNLILAHMVGD